MAKDLAREIIAQSRGGNVVTRADCTQIDAKEDTLMKFTVADGNLTTSVKIKDLDFDACDGGDNFANNNLVGRARRLNELTYLSDAKKEAIEETLVGSTAGKESRRQPFDLRLNL